MATKMQNWVRNSPTFKVLTVLIITLLLLIPSLQIESLIYERSGLQDEVITEISSKWGQRQTITGPILTIPYGELVNEGTKNEKIETRHLHILPELLSISGEIAPKVKKRSIYRAILYQSDLKINGNFDLSVIPTLGIDTSRFQWDKATLSIAISDPRGISKIAKVMWGKGELEILPGLPPAVNLSSGIHGKAKLNDGDRQVSFSGEIELKGSSSFYVSPLGKTTDVKIKSSWPDPSFVGSFLPEGHTVREDGFTANWRILDYNRSFSQVWQDYFPDLTQWNFGVDFIEPVDIYQKTNRAVKYAFMIIALTFSFFFFFEILRRLKIHPIQYTIVGFAMLIFYVVLVALSEHMSFGLAFLSSAAAIVAIVSYYFYFISKSLRVTALFAALFSFIYGFIYVILNAEAYSLLIGSLGLLVLIAMVMHFTRNVDWYGAGDETDEIPPEKNTSTIKIKS